MIFLGLGGNLPSAIYGPPSATLRAALAALDARGVRPVRQSRWYRSAPVPDDGSSWYTNGVAQVSISG